MNKTKSSISKHPQYLEYASVWQQMRDTSKGERAVKAMTTAYLPKTPGQLADKTHGDDAYSTYLQRAVWHNYVRNTQIASIGILHRENPEISLPSRMEAYADAATDTKDSVPMLLRRINEQQLGPGRVGLLLEIAPELSDTPITTLWDTERVVNWDSDNEEPQWIILDESDYKVSSATMTYTWVEQYRLLALDSVGFYFTRTFKTWSVGLLADPDEPAEYPVYRGRRLDRIPFTMCNSSNLLLDVEEPPLLEQSDMCLALYRGDADYRHTLFLQSFALLFLKGFKPDELDTLDTGPGRYISAQSDEAAASFVEVSGGGLAELRTAQTDMMNYIANLGVELSDESAAESGKALSTRLTIKTANLETIAITAAAAVTQQLQHMRRWMGVQEEAGVAANTDFIADNETAAELATMWANYSSGAISLGDYYHWLRSKDFTRLTLEDFVAALPGLNNQVDE